MEKLRLREMLSPSSSSPGQYSPTVQFLLRRQCGINASDVGSGDGGANSCLHIFLGSGDVHNVALSEIRTLRDEITTLHLKRRDDSLLSRVATDIRGRPLDMSIPTRQLDLFDVLYLPQLVTAPRPDTPPLAPGTLGQLIPSLSSDPQEELLQSLATQMKDQIPTSTNGVGLRVFEDTFRASAAIEWLQAQHSTPAKQAIAICRELELHGLITHVCNRHIFDGSRDRLYRFTLDRAGSSASSLSTVDPTAVGRYQMEFWSLPGVDKENLQKYSKKEMKNVLRLAGYVPSMALKHLILQNGHLKVPMSENVSAAVLVADISGFTQLCEIRVPKGAIGVEQLTNTLNEYFSHMIDVILHHGGDIVKFAGDALLVVWPSTDPAGLAYSTRVACQCALALQSQLEKLEQEETSLMLHIGISAGTICCAHVGGSARAEFLILGEPLDQASICENYAAPGEICIHEAAISLAGPTALVLAPKSPRRSDLVEDESKELVHKLCGVVEEAPLHVIYFHINPVIAPSLEAYVPAAVPAHIASGNPEEFLAEVRTVTTMFINLKLKHDVASLTAGQGLKRLQAAFAIVHDCVNSAAGFIRQFIVDDKGTVLIAAFGLPPTSHEDDPLRALRASTQIMNRLKEEERINASIGLTTGRVFCGPVGSDQRREYAMVGNVVNLAARLMSKVTNSGVICDRSTYISAQSRFKFHTLPPVTVKGFSAPVDVFSPLGEFESSDAVVQRRKAFAQAGKLRTKVGTPATSPGMLLKHGSSNINSAFAFIERNKEKEQVRAIISKLTSFQRDPFRAVGQLGTALTIEGDSGTGKSRLISELKILSRHSQLELAVGYSYSSNASTNFASFKGILWKILGVETIKSLLSSDSDQDSDSGEPLQTKTETIKQVLNRRLGAHWIEYAPLLSDFIPQIEIPETATTRQLSGSGRAFQAAELCLELIRNSEFDIIILENAQWMDSMSWWMVFQLLKTWSSPQRLLVMTLRPPRAEDNSSVLAYEYKNFKASKIVNVVTITLTIFNEDQMRQLVSQQLQVPLTGIPDAVLKPLYDSSFGNPSLAAEILTSLTRNNDLYVVDGNTVALRSTDRFAMYRDLHGGDSILGSVIMSSVDSLSAADQLLLKVAATIGIEFRLDILYDVLKVISPISVDIMKFVSTIRELRDMGLVVSVEADPPTCAFKNGATAAVLYKLMLFSQRKLIHQKIAEWLTENSGLSMQPSVLAFHWKGAEAWETALSFMDSCSRKALAQYANSEAIEMLHECINVYQKLDTETANKHRIRLASWHRMLGTAYFNLRNFPMAQNHLEQGIGVLNLTTVKAGAAMVPEMLQKFAKRLSHIKKTHSIAKYDRFICKIRSSREADVLLENGNAEAALLYFQLCLVNFYVNDRAESAFCALKSLQVSAELGMVREYTAAASMCILVLASYGLHSLAEDLLIHAGRFASPLTEDPDFAAKEPLARYYMSVATFYGYQGNWPLAHLNIGLCNKLIAAYHLPMLDESVLLESFVSLWQGNFVVLAQRLDDSLKRAAEVDDLQFRTFIQAIRATMYLIQRDVKNGKECYDEIFERLRFFLTAIPTKDAASRLPQLLLQPTKVLLLSRGVSSFDLLTALNQLLDLLESYMPLHMFGCLCRIHTHANKISTHSLDFINLAFSPKYAVIAISEASVRLLMEHTLPAETIQRARSCLEQYSNTVPALKSSLLLFEASIDDVNGKSAAALEKRKAALDMSEDLDQPLMAAFALVKMGDSASLRKARSVFDEQGIKYTRASKSTYKIDV